MTYQSNFTPTWLYIKTHNITGQKYFGKTINKNPYRYKGSGRYWLRHIMKYGNNVHTELIGPFYSKEDIQLYALMFSITNDIVNSPKWANLIYEDGLSGSGSHLKGKKGRIWTDSQKLQMSKKLAGFGKGIPKGCQSDQHKLALKLSRLIKHSGHVPCSTEKKLKNR